MAASSLFFCGAAVAPNFALIAEGWLGWLLLCAARLCARLPQPELPVSTGPSSPRIERSELGLHLHLHSTSSHGSLARRPLPRSTARTRTFLTACLPFAASSVLSDFSTLPPSNSEKERELRLPITSRTTIIQRQKKKSAPSCSFAFSLLPHFCNLVLFVGGFFLLRGASHTRKARIASHSSSKPLTSRKLL